MPGYPHYPIGMTFSQHVAEQQQKIPRATGELTGLLTEIMVAAKIISSNVRKAGLADVLGLTGRTNVQGEKVQILDDFANETIIRNVRHTGHLCAMASEEMETILPVPEEFEIGSYLLFFDPLDGSSNIDVNASIGTIFAIHNKRSPGNAVEDQDLYQPGKNLIVSGYIIYGSSTILVYTAGQGVYGFTLDPSAGEFLLSHANIRIPESGACYSVNEGNTSIWEKPIQEVIAAFKGNENPAGKPYRARYIGSLVADFHRNLIYGGVFLYPADNRYPTGKLRLFFEANPLAHIVKHAGGEATDGQTDILDIIPTSLHQRTPLIIGSPKEVQFIRDRCFQK
ncbi:MAG: class 1 fructose-bisphosphatase [Candidatus Eisenbacteria bacterium]|uniref:Fructose-1,6-bisphosphatase class 1 n=1 Tax=Eiseniibacteriota bacterium TaxID=2212470 RepID=A0A948WEM6_UNCEI|nr:class 1 fructose-bisphosphatase [Candidatus Eisenbacteria bacterium]MBU1948426.1 class 1 fructose-bisphosphatase [Candidatus Eisenbacteria bacterium]MBU2692903.1 class 1 fructose-bisphosphatase [Candidatus Eisenbacteria bacterium]